MNSLDCVPLVMVSRGEVVESIHYGAFVVARAGGGLRASEGNQELMTFPRSSIKPFQALPLIENGGAEAFNFTNEEIAILCASHTGTDQHYEVLQGIHRKVGIREDDLACGVHWPMDAPTHDAMKKAGLEPTAFRHNCSGKHSGMLGFAVFLGIEKKDYLNPQHPVQVRIRETLSEMVQMKPDAMPFGVDGCSAPVYGILLSKMARAVAVLADPVNLAPERAQACQKISTAMMSHPRMVAGPSTFDTDLMTVAKGKVFSKGGAEGYQIIGVMPGVLEAGSPGLGLAIKISDGDFRGRARSAVSLAILIALGVLSEDDLKQLDRYGNIPVKNWREIEVGEIRPAFQWSLSIE